MWDWLRRMLAALGGMVSQPPRADAATRGDLPDPPAASAPALDSEPAPPAQRPADETSPPPQGERILEPLVVELEKHETSGSAKWFARIAGEEFLVGAEVRYRDRRGLMLCAPQSGYLKFDADAFRDTHGVWADMIAVTAEAEGKGDLCTVNTYDRADFTFGLMQWAAHTPDDNFVLLLRKLLSLPNAPAYFPDLRLDSQGRVAQTSGQGLVTLESASSTEALRRYLNPDRARVDEAEARAAAKLMHWVRRDAAARSALIAFAVEHYRRTVAEVARAVPLDGKTDVEVLCCADIRHQGRGSYAAMRDALSKAQSVEALLEIGAAEHGARVRTLRAEILRGLADRRLGLHRYKASSGEMVEALQDGGWRWPEAHVVRANITRGDAYGVCRLSEAGAPSREASADAAAKAEALRRIALWLNPRGSTRYQRPQGERTRCNIYAYDFATLAGAYLPRVWWDGAALDEVKAGGSPPVVFERNTKNVRELTANDLMRWFRTYSDRYGWREIADVRTLQEHANQGGVSVIVARNKREGLSGHIAIVAPEGSADEDGVVWTAKRPGGAFVPVQSQAGAVNFSFGCGEAWWGFDNMAEHGFWAHD